MCTLGPAQPFVDQFRLYNCREQPYAHRVLLPVPLHLHCTARTIGTTGIIKVHSNVEDNSMQWLTV